MAICFVLRTQIIYRATEGVFNRQTASFKSEDDFHSYDEGYILGGDAKKSPEGESVRFVHMSGGAEENFSFSSMSELIRSDWRNNLTIFGWIMSSKQSSSFSGRQRTK